MLKKIIPSFAFITFSSLLGSYDMASAMDKEGDDAAVKGSFRKGRTRTSFAPVLPAVVEGSNEEADEISNTRDIKKKTCKTLPTPRKKKNKAPK